MRLKDKRAVVVGAGQTPGDTIGIGRATALAFAREGAQVLLVDARLESADETKSLIEAEGGKAVCLQADVSKESDCRSIADACLKEFGGVDLLQFNVGIAVGDSIVTHIEQENWDRIIGVNLRGCLFTNKWILPIMQKQRSGSIVNVSSISSRVPTPLIAYRSSKAGLEALTQSIALSNAEVGIRANVVMPGLINTPLAIEGYAKATGRPKGDIVRERDAAVPLRRKMGTAWDVAGASVFLHSDEAQFITGVVLPVDGGQSAKIG